MSAIRQTKQINLNEDEARAERRFTPRDAKLRLRAIEDARSPRVLDANTNTPRYLCVGFAVIRI